MQNLCIVVGAPERTKKIKELLETSEVPTAAIPQNFGYGGITTTCKSNEYLCAVAILCKDFPIDYGASLCALIRSQLPGVGLHAFVESQKVSETIRSKLELAGVNEITGMFPLPEIKVAERLKTRWFPAGSEKVWKKTARLPKAVLESTAAPASAASVPAFVPQVQQTVTVAKTAAPQKAATLGEELEQRGKAALATTSFARPVTTPVLKPGEGPFDVDKAVTQLEGVLTKMLSKTRRNDPLPKEPFVVNIVGKHGQSLALDPRRIRTLESTQYGNPRLPDSPGFTKESLGTLAKEIMVAGQMEDIMVCPLVGDPNFDAQLIDGERRQRSALLMGFMIYANVREDVTPEEAQKLYLMAVIRNRQKVEPTIQENILVVQNLRKGFGMTIDETAETMGISTATVSTLQKHGACLHPQVLAMLGDGGKDSQIGKISSQHAGLLHDVQKESQLKYATEIVSKKMNFPQAQRYIKAVRRELGLGETPAGRKRPSERSQALATLVRNSYNHFGVYWDYNSSEFGAMMNAYMPGARQGVYDDILRFIKMMSDLAERVKPPPAE